MKDGENRISLIKEVKITDGKACIKCSALSNKIKRGGVESLSVLGSNGVSVKIGHNEVASDLKRNNPKIISIYNHRLALAILTFFKESAKFLKKNI